MRVIWLEFTHAELGTSDDVGAVAIGCTEKIAEHMNNTTGCSSAMLYIIGGKVRVPHICGRDTIEG